MLTTRTAGMVTNLDEMPPQEVWRWHNKRANVEIKIDELTYLRWVPPGLGLDGAKKTSSTGAILGTHTLLREIGHPLGCLNTEQFFSIVPRNPSNDFWRSPVQFQISHSLWHAQGIVGFEIAVVAVQNTGLETFQMVQQ